VRDETRVVRVDSESPSDSNARCAAHRLLTSVTASADRLGESLARAATQRGLAVTLADGSRRPIPIGALPVVIDGREIERRGELAARLASATAKAARWRMSGAHRAVTLAALGPAESRLVRATWDGPEQLAVARVDFMGSPTLQALEVNATIPAMQGYSDIAAESWLRTFAGGRADLHELIAANGSNADALLHALVELYGALRGGQPGALGILCRRGDAQLSELTWLRDRFCAAGLATSIVHPDGLVLRAGLLHHDGRALPLIYRHLFLNRLDATPAPDVEAALLAPSRVGTLVLNRPAPHLEMKSTLAWLSRCVDAPELADRLGLTARECEAIASSVPWTRQLGAAGEGFATAEDLQEIVEHPSMFVLKRSWSYGGSDVFIGRASATVEFRDCAQRSFPGVERWDDLVRRAAADTRGGGFVVQRAVLRQTGRQIFCTPDAIRHVDAVTDYAAYASLGATAAWSGVCRAAASDIVNIVGGGAVVPILRREVAERLFPDAPSSMARQE
jgi:hypothetical protein